MILLQRPYAGYAAGTVVELPKSTEDTLIAAGQAQTSVAQPTPGPVSTFVAGGACAIATGQSSIVITNPIITPQSLIYAIVAQAAADATLTQVVRVLAAQGSFTIFGNANATANTTVDWAVLSPFGTYSSPT